MAEADAHQSTRNREGWRWLGVFWLTILLSTAIGAGVVQWLGPPPGISPQASNGTPGTAASGPATLKPVVVLARPVPVVRMVAGRDTPGPIADPDPMLLEPLSDGSKRHLPRISSDQRPAMQVYAAGYDRTSLRPRVGLLLAGIGMNEAESDVAIRTLPGAVSLAVSPYAAANGAASNGAAQDEARLTRLLATARATGHEYLIALPLEPAGFPLNDPGSSTLLTSVPASVNIQNLYWALSRIDGYVGATGVIGRGRRDGKQ